MFGTLSRHGVRRDSGRGVAGRKASNCSHATPSFSDAYVAERRVLLVAIRKAALAAAGFRVSIYTDSLGDIQIL